MTAGLRLVRNKNPLLSVMSPLCKVIYACIATLAFGFTIDSRAADAVVAGISRSAGKRVSVTSQGRPVGGNIFQGSWQEVARQDVVAERGCSRVLVEFFPGGMGTMRCRFKGWDNGAGVWRELQAPGFFAKASKWDWLRRRGNKGAEETESVECLIGDKGAGWMGMIDAGGLRVLSRKGGLSPDEWRSCHSALRAAGYSVEGLVYFLNRD
jgi:hypothetical protein